MPALPRGTITLMFTDLEGSTRLLQALGEGYAEVLTQHRTLLESAFEQHQGIVVDRQGDGYFVAFARASDAVGAAIAGQRALAKHPWPSPPVSGLSSPDGPLPVRVRMGLHTGEPMVAGDSYVGMDVHRAARIAAAGHGTQILLSRTTADLVEDDMPAELGLIDLGSYRLKDLARPERIFQVVAPDLPVDFPPLQAETMTGDQPLRVTGLAGRGRELTKMQRLLAETPVEPADLLRAVRETLQLEYQQPSLRLGSSEYSGEDLNFDSSNSVLLEFPTLQPQFPDLYDSPAYRMLFSVGLARESQFSPSLLNQLDRLRRRCNIDKVVLWSAVPVDEQTRRLLKATGAEVVAVDPKELAEALARPLLNYLPLPGRGIDYSVYVNHLAHLIVKRLKKLFHLVLSEIVAPIFDRHYASGHVATRAILEFEQARLRELIDEAEREGSTRVAVEIGCATGRHSFLLAQSFEEVYAYDIAPRMIEAAERTKRERGDTRISFCVNDVEHEELSDEDRFYGRADLVVMSFGEGSFVEDTVRMLRRIHDWLTPGGTVFLSFYNENSLALRLTPAWRDSSLAARLEPKTSSLCVSLPGGLDLNIFCKPYNETTKGEINKLFDIDRIYSYPTVMSFLPNSVLQDELAEDVFGEIDGIIANAATCSGGSQLRRSFGHYIIVVARRRQSGSRGYSNVMAELAGHPGIHYELVEHRPVLSVEDAQRELGGDLPLSSIVKTLIFKLGGSHDYVAIVLPGDKKIDRDALARRFGVARSRIKFASEKEVSELGFPLGSVAPFGFVGPARVRRHVDASLREDGGEWLYMGVGDNQVTLKLRRQDFLTLVRDSEWLRI
jgi:class 3 adenylate cyclase/prolyl-tRNA editing enzyme YbaK/EbsC (Cys-tRNA(Pro) deacylase)/SAM-dependent methyltransferase